MDITSVELEILCGKSVANKLIMLNDLPNPMESARIPPPTSTGRKSQTSPVAVFTYLEIHQLTLEAD